MKTIESQFNRIEVVRKYYYVFLALLFLQFWWFWQYRNQIVKDFAFVTENTSITNGKILYINYTKVELLVGTNANAKVNKHNGYNYIYDFVANGKTFVDFEFSLDKYQNENEKPSETKNIYIQYIKTNPKINRIEKFAKNKTKFDFFREYFLYKIISVIVVWLFLKYAESRPTEN